LFHQTKDELETLRIEMEDEIKKMKADQQARIESFKVKAHEDWKLINNLKSQ
jgi:hypothetical protein